MKRKKGKFSTLLAVGGYLLLALFWTAYVVKQVREQDTATRAFWLGVLGVLLVVCLLTTAVLCFVRYCRGEDEGGVFHWLKEKLRDKRER